MSLLPVASVHPAVTQAAALQAAFVAIVLLGYATIAVALPGRALPQAGRWDLPSTPALIRVATLMSVIGLAALTYDKVAIQGIDYSEGVAVAREEWRELGEEREGRASSPFSVVGYFFGSAYYVAIVLALTQPRALNPAQRLRALLASFVLLMANSAITGGRSNLLLVAALALAALAARRSLRLRDLLPARTHRRWFALAVAGGMAWLIFVFYQRAQAGEIEALEYALAFLPVLGLEAAPWYQQELDGSALSSLSAMLVLAVSYITHSFATVAAIIEGPVEDKTIVFLHLVGIASKLGLAQPPDGDWFLAGRMPSLPGAFWHQFGAYGFVAGSVLLGALCAAARRWTAHRPRRLLPLGVFVLADATLILTPLLFAADFLSFPYALGSFVQLALLDRWLCWRRRRPRPGHAPSSLAAPHAAQAAAK